MRHRAAAFWRAEDGIVTTDWIILTAAIGGIGIGATVSIRGGVQALSFDIQQSLSNAQIPTLGTLGADNWAYTNLWYTDAQVATMLENIYRPGNPADIIRDYEEMAQQVLEAIASGQVTQSGGVSRTEQRMDLLNAMAYSLEYHHNTPLPDGAPKIRDIRASYDEAVAARG